MGNSFFVEQVSLNYLAFNGLVFVTNIPWESVCCETESRLQTAFKQGCFIFAWERKYLNICRCFCYIISYSAFSSFHLSRYSAPVGETPAGASTGRGPRHWASFPTSTWQTSPAQDRTLWVHLLFYSYVWEAKHGVLNKPHTRAPMQLIFSEFFLSSKQHTFGRLSESFGKMSKIDLIWGYILFLDLQWLKSTRYLIFTLILQCAIVQITGQALF